MDGATGIVRNARRRQSTDRFVRITGREEEVLTMIAKLPAEFTGYSNTECRGTSDRRKLFVYRVNLPTGKPPLDDVQDASCGIISNGRPEERTTFSVTLPRMHRVTPEWPRVAIATILLGVSWASSTMTFAALPTYTCHETSMPRWSSSSVGQYVDLQSDSQIRVYVSVRAAGMISV